MADLADFAGRENLPVLVHAALLYAQFETIHPFVDGDGRTGIGVVRGASWHLKEVAGPGAANRSSIYGRCGDGVLSTHSARTEPGVPLAFGNTEWTELPTSQRVVALTVDAGGNANGVASILSRLVEPRTNLRTPRRLATYVAYNPLFRSEVFRKQDMALGLSGPPTPPRH